MKIYTRKGDDGSTGLIGGTRVPKHHIRIEAYGTVDELNSWLGQVGDHELCAPYRSFMREIQSLLFTIGSHLASDPQKGRMQLPEITAAHVAALEQSMDEMEQHLPLLKNFVLPGGHPAQSAAHIARCVCRRAERCTVQLNESEPVDPLLIQYLNRLSDWLFMLARRLSQLAGAQEIPWLPQ